MGAERQIDFCNEADAITENARLYSFLATNYDLSQLARKVRTNYSVRKNLLSLKLNNIDM